MTPKTIPTAGLAGVMGSSAQNVRIQISQANAALGRTLKGRGLRAKDGAPTYYPLQLVVQAITAMRLSATEKMKRVRAARLRALHAAVAAARRGCAEAMEWLRGEGKAMARDLGVAAAEPAPADSS